MKILIVEDHPLVSDATRDLLTAIETSASVVVAANAADARSAFKADATWDKVLLDLDVPGAQGLSLAREFHAAGLAGRTCVVSALQKPAYVDEVRSLGFAGYVHKAMQVNDFTDALRKVLRGESAFPTLEAGSRVSAPALTKQQLRILQLVGAGLPSKLIADELGISVGTVNNHVAALLRALHVSSRLQAVQVAFDLGLFDRVATVPSTRRAGYSMPS